MTSTVTPPAVLVRIAGWAENVAEADIPAGGEALTVLHPPTGRQFSLLIGPDQVADPAKLEQAWLALTEVARRALGDDLTPPAQPAERELETRNLAGRVHGRRELLTVKRFDVLIDAAHGTLVGEPDGGRIWRDETRHPEAYEYPGRPAARVDMTRGARDLVRIGWLVSSGVEDGKVVYRPSVVAQEALAGSV